jgi:hypothetical protein
MCEIGEFRAATLGDDFLNDSFSHWKIVFDAIFVEAAATDLISVHDFLDGIFPFDLGMTF